MIRARFRLTLPGDLWVATVSREFPDATFRLLTGVPRGDRALELGEVLADDPGAVAERIASHPDISAFESVYQDDERAIAHYEAVEQRLYAFLWDSSLPPEFPLTIKAGEMTFDVTATRAQFETLGETLDATPFEYDLLSIVHTDEEGTLLTDRQRECLSVALREGYFQVPRDATLAEVAATLDVDTSTASETIRRGIERVVTRELQSRG